jgi:hypothetical protein
MGKKGFPEKKQNNRVILNYRVAPSSSWFGKNADAI